MKKKKIGDIVAIAKGRKAQKVFEEKLPNAVRYIQIEDLRTDNKIQYTADTNGIFVSGSDLCIAWDGANAGTVGYGLSGMIGSTIARLCINDSEIYTPYIGHFLQSKFNILNGRTTGTTIPHVERRRLEELEFPYRPLSEQRRIADILDKVDAIRRKRQQSLKLTDDLVKSQFIEMFGDPVTNPKGWPIAKVGDLADVFTGGTPSRNKLDYYIGNIPWVKTGEIEQGLIFNAEERISEKALKETNCKLLPVNTILVAMYGQGKTRGQAGILKIKAATNQACAAILPNDSYNTDYLHQYLRIQYEALRGLGRGAQQANLNLSMVRDFPVLNTPLTLQTQFAAFVGQADKSKFTMQRQLSEIEILSSALKQKFFA